ncbi:MAG: hypothetical protein ACJ74Q_15985 [Pyrinomonadaceae bacterium]
MRNKIKPTAYTLALALCLIAPASARRTQEAARDKPGSRTTITATVAPDGAYDNLPTIWKSGRPPAVEEPRVDPKFSYQFLADPGVLKAAKSAWNLVRAGTVKKESLFVVTVSRENTFVPTFMPQTFEDCRFSFHWRVGTIAVFHTHPNDEHPEPSELDVKLGDKTRVTVFVIHNKGLYAYSPQSRTVTRLYKGLDWL